MTSSPDDASDATAQALAKIVRRMLVRGESVDLPGLGTLDVRHERSTIEERADGEILLRPPKDHVVFTPSD